MLKWLSKLILGVSGSDHARADRFIQEGYVLARTGRLTPALAKYDDACRAAPDHALAHLNRALLRQDIFNLKSRTWSTDEKTKTLVAIVDDLENAAALDPASLATWRCLGHVSRRLRRYRRAHEAFSTLVELAPADYAHRGEAERELRAIKDRADRDRAVDVVMELLRERIESGDEIGAALDAIAPFLDDTRRAIATAATGDDGLLVLDDASDVLSVDVVFAVGVLERRREALVEAAEIQSLVLKLDPEHIGAHRELSTLATAAGNTEAALRHVLAAYRADPSDPALVCNAGVASLAAGNLEDAEEYFDIALKLAPKDPIVEKARRALKDAKARALLA